MSVEKHFVRVASCLALALVAPATLAADAWFGLKVPQGLGDPHAPVVDVRSARPAPAIVPAGEEGYRELSGARIREDVATIVGFSRESHASGQRVWGRVTGFPSARKTIEWSADQLRRAGLQRVEVQEYAAPPESPMWWASDWKVQLLGNAAFGAQSKDIVLQTAVPTSGSMLRAGPIEAALAFVGAITDATIPADDLKGKIAVQSLKPERGAYSERRRTVERARELAKRGAVAVINVVEQTGNMHTRDFGNCGVPCFNVGTADGAFVEAAIAKAAAKGSSVRMRLELSAEYLMGLKGHNAFGIVPGKRDEIIIVNAHADGWYDAAGDNADGLAVLLAMARHFARPENQPECTLVFVSSGGHHSTGLNGPANFVRMNGTLLSKAIMVLNLEHIAQYEILSGDWTLTAREQPMNFGIDNSATYLQDLGQRAMKRYGFNLNPTFVTTVAGDLGGYAPLSIARVQAIHSGPMYHASGDVLETISVPGLERAARFYTYFVSEAAKAPFESLNP